MDETNNFIKITSSPRRNSSRLSENAKNILNQINLENNNSIKKNQIAIDLES